MSSRAEKLLAEFSPNRPKTKPGDHLAWLVTLAKDGDWDDLVEYLAGNQPITARGRIAVAALIKELLEHHAGLSNMALLELVRGMRKGITVHGFRSTFKDWASESTDPVYDNVISEMALWHAIKDETEKAYRRGVLFDRRKLMMADWARYCAQPPARQGARAS